MIFDQYKRPMTVIAGLEPGLGMIDDLMLVNMTASTENSRRTSPGSRHGLRTSRSYPAAMTSSNSASTAAWPLVSLT
jgi:hypothetical protein